MTLSSKWIIASGIILTIATASLASAKPSEKGDRERNGPPPEAFAACESLAVSQTCTIDTPGGMKSGICRAGKRDETRILCVPDDRRRRKGARRNSDKDMQSTKSDE